MSSPWLSSPPPENASAWRERLEEAQATGGRAPVRSIVRDSWRRARDRAVDPDRLPGTIDLDEDALREYRAAHPLASAVPIIHRLLIRHTFDAGLIIAIGDQSGRLLWIDGDRGLRRRAESMAFVEGANWSEEVAGTSAPGTALALDHGIQIRGAEHYSRIVHPWSCTAVPVHDPASGRIVGVIDITGGDEAVAPATLPLLEATVAAVEAELHVRRLDALAEREERPRTPARAAAPRLAEPRLHVLGRETGFLEAQGVELELSARHAEILALLAWHRAGLGAEALAAAVYGRDDAVVTLRAEMVRLRRTLARAGLDALAPLSRPYRLPVPLALDAQRVLAFLDRGAHRVALGHYAGPVLPGSDAPGVDAVRAEVSARLRDAMLADAHVDTLLDYARSDEAALDLPVWSAALRALPIDSPRRTAVVTRIEAIERELGR
ncbi:transcriptional regulator [Microcella daejeonensis]|uniref:Transcriptional regulator n=1 Tax=Microcella daejeonensis TaxID=2994971 RepID=A0A9E8SAZ4_9MICO|nr:GAF domain-containing protein [Microcella daejeonensis]WAB81097.1 transcriptional regulator [Microcella daejeonensis]WAB83267.1 transcriptional regulator [Microcella daejeonensis]